MSDFTYPLVEFQVPAGAARFVSIYKPWGGPGRDLYGLNVPIDMVPEGLVDDVKTSHFDGVTLVGIRTQVRKEVHVRGFHPDDPERWTWLERQHHILELRNLGLDALFREHPIHLVVQRYEFNGTRHGRSGFGIGLTRVEVIAKPGDET